MQKQEETTVTHCPVCGRELFGRADKRFCNDTCRNQYNRDRRAREAAEYEDQLPAIFRVIKNNYEILKSYNLHQLDEQTLISVSKKELEEKGFDFRYFTGISENRREGAFRCCFDLGWQITGTHVSLAYRPDQSV